MLYHSRSNFNAKCVAFNATDSQFSFPFPLFFSQKKKSALFEVAEVVPVMTNNYEENILRGVRDSSYSLESSIELLQKDVVQLHAPRYQSMRRVSFSPIQKI